MKLWQRAVIMAAVSVCMTAGIQNIYGGAETGPAADERINEPRGPAMETSEENTGETQDPDAAYGPALEAGSEEKNSSESAAN